MPNKKIRKLIRDPKLFFRDMLGKRLAKWGLVPGTCLFPLVGGSKNGHFRYTVISAVYNVEKYLDYYFRTLTRQTLNFKEHIHLIMVDDGSTDSSASIIEKWRQRFPDNITYLRKENGGQASARNLGLEYVETDYVTFIDPDDFVAPDYFQVIDQFLIKNQTKSIRMVGTNMIFYREVSAAFQDTHPLRYRFVKGNALVNIAELGKFIQLSAATAVFETDIIKRTTLGFDEKIRPSFEDAHFVGRYLGLAGVGHAAFLKDAKYFYRKRDDRTSTLDATWEHSGYFDEVLRLGCIGLIEFWKDRRQGFIPEDVQRVLLYHTIWQIKAIINYPEKIKALNNEQKKKFALYMDEIYSAINNTTILEFDLAGAWFYHKVGLLYCFKDERPPFQIVYVDAYDAIKKQVKLVYYTGEPLFEEFLLNGRDKPPAYLKTARHDFLDRTFVHTRFVWLPISDEAATLQVRLDGQMASLSLAGKRYLDGVLVTQIVKHFSSSKSSINELDGTWLLMDRDTQADDNAEHLYRYLRSQHPDQKIRFVLRKESHDWPRLQAEGFDLLAYGSAAHEAALRKCSKIVSSHIDQYVVDYFRDGSLKEKSIVFLQHGVTKDDMSAWLNNKKIDCFITAGSKEYKSISGDNNRYKLSTKEVVLTGFARHDALLRLQASLPAEKIILVMPTWRQALSGEIIEGNIRGRNLAFMTSLYAQAWRSFLSSNRLQALALAAGYRVVFFPHANTQPYLSEFDLPDHIHVASHDQGTIQDWFCRAAFMVTDFSSVAFDMAFLQKPVVYYQFDRESFYNGGHTLQAGYFSYDEDGFGPVCFDESKLIDHVEEMLARNAKPSALYRKRITDFFAYRDGINCERIVQVINAIDSPQVDLVAVSSAVRDHALVAERFEKWDLAEQRWREFLANTEISFGDRTEAQQHLIHVLKQQNSSVLDDLKAGLLMQQDF
jgi:CDP-glycerol glycerophosphotransferase (TagB/SpsB family)/GT2 family glycosyltransferase